MTEFVPFFEINLAHDYYGDQQKADRLESLALKIANLKTAVKDGTQISSEIYVNLS